jgi:SAM-dependent methyltransferase
MTFQKSNLNVLRNLALDDFSTQFLKGRNFKSVAVVGGSINDHEVILIRRKFPKVNVEVFGIEENQKFLDLNTLQSIRGRFDLVLCTNVIEHIFNHENFAENLINLLRKGGSLWCCFPFNDMYHGSPYYFSAGFHPDYLIKLFERHGGAYEKCNIISSRRLYLFTHLLKDWPSEFRYHHPLIGQIIWSLGLRGNPRPPIKNLFPSRLLICLLISWTPKKFTSNPKDGCGSWVLIRRV